MALVILNVKGMGSLECHIEYKKLLVDKKIEVFKALETKMKRDKFIDFLRSLEDEWYIGDNVDQESDDDRESIWVGWKKNAWSY